MSSAMPIRTLWNAFPDVVIHSPEPAVKKPPQFLDAKSGDAEADFAIVQDTVSVEAIDTLRKLVGAREPVLISAHAFEKTGVNAIPEALADELGLHMCLPVDGSIVQINVVGHTGADGFSRLARQAAFDGDVITGWDYLLVDDFIGQGGTLGILKAIVESKGG